MICQGKYNSSITQIAESSLDEVLEVDGFQLGFSAHCEQLQLEPVGVVLPLLRQVRELGQLGSVPKGEEGCGECRLVERLVGEV